MILSSFVSLAELFIEQQSASYLISKVFGVICSGLIYLPMQTISYITQVGNFSSLMKQIVNHQEHFLTPYDRRLLCLAFLSAFRLKVQESQIDEDALKWFEAAILTLHVQRVEEDIKGAQSSQSYTKDKRKKLFKETRSEEDKQDMKLYNMIVGRGIDLDKLLSDDESTNPQTADDELMGDMLRYMNSAKLSANRSVHKLQSPLNKVDEFGEFQKIFADFRTLLGLQLGPLVLDRISSIARECLAGVLKSQKMRFGGNGGVGVGGGEGTSAPAGVQVSAGGVGDEPQAARKIAKLKVRVAREPGEGVIGQGFGAAQGGLFGAQLN